MDFDHRDARLKEFSLHSVHRKTKRAILREIEKCDVVCANCHRERTHRRVAKRPTEE
jgi:L-lysine 2,3-aminomutase